MTDARQTRTVLDAILARRIMILDGAMGTMIQAKTLTEAEVRGSRFATHGHALRGNHDVLVLTCPTVTSDIHRRYLDAGADIIETNTFNANAISQADYGLHHLVYELNVTAARLAREAADEASLETAGRRRFVAGAIGPTNRMLSVSTDVGTAAFRPITFDTLKAAYLDQVRGLIDGGVDLLLVETIVDPLNAKAAIAAIQDVQRETAVDLPLMLSLTVDRSGRTLSGQTVEAFYVAIEHAKPWAVGINCSFGAKDIRPFLEDLARVADCWVSAYPNAGLPNAFGNYDERPAETAAFLRDFALSGFVNIIGGCCGTGPEHIRALSSVVKDVVPRPRRIGRR